MPKLLVTAASMTGSTLEVAQVVGEVLGQHGWPAEVLPVDQVAGLDAYAGVVVGGPMIMGWHRSALGFLRRHRAGLQRLPLAIFVMGMSLTTPEAARVGGVPVTLDEKFPKPPAAPGRLSLRERYTTLSHYLTPVLAAARPAVPASIGVFAGRLEYGRLPWWGVLFCTVIVQAPAGDRRNWPAIRAWAAGLPAAFRLAAPAAAAPPSPA